MPPEFKRFLDRYRPGTQRRGLNKLVTSVSQVLHLRGYRQWRNHRLETSWSQKQVTWKTGSKVAPKTASKFQLQNTSLPEEAETALGCQASLLGSFSPQAGQVMLPEAQKLRSSGSSHAEQELALPAWSVQLRLVHQSQTCWAGSPERKLLRAQSRPGEYPPPICSLCRAKGILSEGLSDVCSGCCYSMGLLGAAAVGLWVPKGPVRSEAFYLLVKTAKDT